MRIWGATLIIGSLMSIQALAVEIYTDLPSNCEVIESFTLYSKSSTRYGRTRELVKEVQVDFDAVVFSKYLYQLREEQERSEHEKWLSKQDPAFVQDPNFYGVPKDSKKYMGVLLLCSK